MNCLHALLGQIVCDKDGVVDWCIVLVEMPLTRLEKCWPLPIESLPEPQRSNPNPNPLANQLWCIDFLTPPTPLIFPYTLPAFFESLMSLKNWCSIHVRFSKSNLKHFIHFYGIFCKFKTQFYCILFFLCVLMSRLHFEIHQLWQSGLRCIPIAAVAVHLKLKS